MSVSLIKDLRLDLEKVRIAIRNRYESIDLNQQQGSRFHTSRHCMPSTVYGT
jgi:hypothetical protein